MKLFLALSIFILNFSNSAQAQNNSGIKNAWVEMGPHNQIVARVITSQDCPAITIDQNSVLNMSMRAGKSKNFPVNVCEATIPPYAQVAEINQQQLVLPNKPVQRIVVIGDTGCRIKNWESSQACNDPNQWPFAKIAQQAAKSNPDLVIHVGDYYYREQACEAKDKGCTGSPYGDNWLSWQADFFKPATPLLAAAPWIFVRGNHEDCNRGGLGWFRFLDPFKYSATCRTYSPIYSVHINNVKLIVLDSSNANDFSAPSKQVKIFTKYFQEISTNNTKNAKNIWLLTHKPIWVVAEDKQTIHPYSTLQKAIEHNLAPQLNLILSGHIHRFAALNFNNGRPAQVLNGNSGTLLDTALIETILEGFFVANSKMHEEFSLDQFGYLVLEKVSEGWRAQEHNIDGKIVANCTLQKKYFICLPQH